MKKIIDECIRAGASSAQCFTLGWQSESLGYTAGKLEKIDAEHVEGHNLSLIKDGRQAGLVFNGDGSGVADRAIEMVAQAGQAEYEYPAALEPAPMEQLDDGLMDRSRDELVAMADGLVARLQEIGADLSVNGGLGRSWSHRTVTNSKGVEVDHGGTMFSMGASVSMAAEGDILNCGATRFRHSFFDPVDEIVEEVRQKFEWSKNIVDVEPGTMKVIFNPEAMAQLSFAMDALMGHSVFTGVSPFKGRIGDKVASEKVTLVDDALLPDGPLSHPYDDEGTAGQRTVLIEKGILKSYLVNLRSAAKLDLAPTGNGLRNKMIFNDKDFALGASEGFTNLVLEAGDMSLDAMLAAVGDGLIVDSLFGLVMGNTVVGEVNTSIDHAYAVRGGKIVGRVKGRAIGANLWEMFTKHLVGLEDRLTFRSGIGNGSFYMPHALFEGLTIA